MNVVIMDTQRFLYDDRKVVYIANEKALPGTTAGYFLYTYYNTNVGQCKCLC